ncbi:MAG: fibronectin type III domain-containing protein [Bacteroidales bacterium]
MKRILFCIAILLSTFGLNAQTEPCVAPDAPTALNFTKISSNSISATFVKATADAHLVVMTEGLVLNLSPVEGKTYKIGDTIGNGIVKALPSGTSFSVSNLKGHTAYSFYVFSYNKKCINGPIYCANALNASTNTKVGPPNLEIIKVESTFLEFKATQSPQFIVVLRNNYVLPSSSSITGKLKQGDTLSDGSIVIYKGSDIENLRIANLQVNTPYFLTAYGIEANDTVYSNTNTVLSERTLAQLPVYYLNDWSADNVNGPNTPLPAGFSRTIYNTANTLQNFYLRAPQSEEIPEIPYIFEMQVSSNYSKSIVGDLITPTILLGSGTHRLYFDYACLSYGWFPEDYTFKESDSICVQISADGKNFENLFVVNKQNQSPNKMSLAKQAVIFDTYQNKAVKFRFVYTTSSKSALRLTAIKVESLPNCDYPISVVVPDSTIESKKACIHWVQTNTVDPLGWNISYYDTLQKMWSPSQRVDSMPAWVEGLQSTTNYRVKVQAVCAENTLSPWSDPSALFFSRYAVPFMDDFTGCTYVNPLPKYWEKQIGVLTDTADLVFSGESYAWNSTGWRGDASNPSLISSLSGQPKNDWVLTPVFDLDEAGASTQLEFDFALNTSAGVGGIDTVSPGSQFIIVLSPDGGHTWNTKHILKGYGAGSTNPLYLLDSVHEKLDLSAYKGKVRIGFYVHSVYSKPSASIFLDNIKVDYTCRPITNLLAKDCKENQVQLAWESTQATEFLIRYKIKNENQYKYSKSSSTQFLLSSLSPDSEYECAVAGMCSTTDTGKWLSIHFVTPPPYVCDTVRNLKVGFVERYAALLKWEGEASSYHFRYRVLGEDTWTLRNTDTTNIQLSALKEGTEYEYSVQAQCSNDTTDVSLWTAPKVFMTLQISCPVPTDIRVLGTTYRSITFTWVSDADRCELNMRKQGVEIWDTFEIGRDTITIDRLTPDMGYEYRLRALCSAGDHSDWSDTAMATTTFIPDCAMPTHLRTSAITETSAMLQWEGAAIHKYWNVRYRKVGAERMDTVLYLQKTQLELTQLVKNTAYTWSVQALCDEFLSSEWASPEGEFTTIGVGNMPSKEYKENFGVSAKYGQISILNPQALCIDKVEIVSTNGQILDTYKVKTNQNILIPTSLKEPIVILRLYTQNQQLNYKIYLQ